MTDRGRRRRFTRVAERIALYLAAGGRCTSCGAPLTRGWHADHVHPFSAGGPTDVANGQALCPACNLQKGSASAMSAKSKPARPANFTPYQWQRNAYDAFLGRISDDDPFFLVVTTAGGKTWFAAMAAVEWLDRYPTTGLIVYVVPTATLRQQVAVEAKNPFNLELDYKFENRHLRMTPGMHGIVVTYAAVATHPEVYRSLASQHDTLVILDEVHHCQDAPEEGPGDPSKWGEALRQAFDIKGEYLRSSVRPPKVMPMSGTPLRTDRQPVPYCKQDKNGRPTPDFIFTMSDALANRPVPLIRAPSFLHLDADVGWRRPGELADLNAVRLSDLNDETRSKGLRAATDPYGDFFPSLAKQMYEAHRRLQQRKPDAAAIVLAKDVYTARKYKEELERFYDRGDVLLAVYEPEKGEEPAADAIRRFRKGRGEVLVTVRMAGEGLDVPRAAILLYMSDIRTAGFVQQVVGRVIRRSQKPGVVDVSVAQILAPADPELVAITAALEQVIEGAGISFRDPSSTSERGPRSPKDPPPFTPFDYWSNEAEDLAGLLGKVKTGERELALADRVLALNPGELLGGKVELATAFKLAEQAGATLPDLDDMPPAPPPPPEPEKTRRDLITEECARLNGLVGLLVNAKAQSEDRELGELYKEAHGTLNLRYKVPSTINPKNRQREWHRDQCSLETLNAMCADVEQQLRDLGEGLL